MAAVPLADYIAGQAKTPISSQVGGVAPRTLATGPPPDEGISPGRAIASGANLLPKTLAVASDPSVGTAAGLGLAGASAALGLADEPEAAAGVGLAAPLVEGGARTLAALGTEGASLADAAAQGFGGAGFMVAWNAPKMAETLYRLIEGNEATVRRGKRDVVANRLTHAIGTPLLRSTRADLPNVLATQVAGGTIGDAVAAMLRFQGDGTWATDTAHGWFPDPALGPLRNYLEARGYTGSREPKAGDVGGVGEIVAGGGAALIPNDLMDFLTTPPARGDQRALPIPETARRLGFTEHHQGVAQPGSAELAAFGWDLALRNLTERITGQPITRPSPFVAAWAQPYDEIQEGVVSDEGGTPARRRVEPPDILDFYAEGELAPDVATRLREAQEARQWARAAERAQGEG